MTTCDLCGKAYRRLRPEAIEKALEEHYEKFPDSDWDYWDECYTQEMMVCGGCPEYNS